MTAKRPPTEFVTKAEFARRMGVTAQAVSKFSADLVMDQAGALVDFWPSKKAWEAKPRRIAKGNRADRSEQSAALLAAQIEKAEADAALKRHRLEVEQGRYVDRQEAELQYFTAARMIRDELLSIPQRGAATICAELELDISLAHKVERILDGYLRRTLDDLADKIGALDV